MLNIILLQLWHSAVLEPCTAVTGVFLNAHQPEMTFTCRVPTVTSTRRQSWHFPWPSSKSRYAPKTCSRALRTSSAGRASCDWRAGGGAIPGGRASLGHSEKK